MKIMFRIVAALLMVAGTNNVAPGQEVKPKLAPPGDTGGLMFSGRVLDFVKDKGVQKDLKLTDEQVKKLDEALKQQAEWLKELGGKADQQKLKELAEASKKSLAGVLTDEQAKRVDQLMLQASGPVVFFTPKVQDALQLSNEQKLMFGQVLTESMKKRFEMLKDVKGIRPDDVMKKIAEANRAAVEDIVKTLTTEQQAKWKQLVGPRFEGVLPPVPVEFGVGPRLPGQSLPPEFLPYEIERKPVKF